MIIHAFFFFAMLALVVAVRYLRDRFSKAVRESRLEDELNQIFLWFWDGSPEDELYAWYKVRSVLRQREGIDRRVDYVDHKIQEFNKQSMHGRFVVNESGELVQNLYLVK